jgi:hypothetical protein
MFGWAYREVLYSKKTKLMEIAAEIAASVQFQDYLCHSHTVTPTGQDKNSAHSHKICSVWHHPRRLGGRPLLVRQCRQPSLVAVAPPRVHEASCPAVDANNQISTPAYRHHMKHIGRAAYAAHNLSHRTTDTRRIGCQAHGMRRKVQQTWKQSTKHKNKRQKRQIGLESTEASKLQYNTNNQWMDTLGNVAIDVCKQENKQARLQRLWPVVGQGFTVS